MLVCMIYKYSVEHEPCSIESYPAHFIKLPLKNPSSSFQRPHPNLVSPFLPIFFRILQYLSIAKSRPTANIYASKSGHRKKNHFTTRGQKSNQRLQKHSKGYVCIILLKVAKAFVTASVP